MFTDGQPSDRLIPRIAPQEERKKSKKARNKKEVIKSRTKDTTEAVFWFMVRCFKVTITTGKAMIVPIF
jgi:hypothetical protein